MERKTPLYETHLRYGGKMVPFGGYLLPVQYQGVIAEHMAVRTACGLFDVSHMCEFLCEGPRALENLNWLLTNDFSGMRDGQARYSPLCNETGGVVDDLLVYKEADNRYLIPASAMGGAVFLTFCDLLARTIAVPAEIAVGIITAVIGAPYFLYLIYRSRKEQAR